MALFPNIRDVEMKEIVTEMLHYGTCDSLVNHFSSSSDGSAMGSATASIRRRRKKPHSGGQYTITARRPLDFMNPIGQGQELSGNEQIPGVDTQVITMRPVKYPIKMEDVEQAKLMTAIDFRSEYADLLKECVTKELELTTWSLPIIGHPSSIFYRDAAYWNHGAVGVKPVYDRIVLSGVAPARADYDNAGGNFRQISGVNGILAQIPDPVANMFSTTELVAMRRKARNQQTENLIENPITYVAKGLQTRDYNVMLHPDCVSQLETDPIWQANATMARNLQNQPNNLAGDLYRGSFKGMHVYENEWLDYCTITENGHKFAFNYVMGRSMVDQNYYQAPKIIAAPDNGEWLDKWAYAMVQYRGNASTRFASKTGSGRLVEYGAIINISCIS